jgi:hypothetical protein
MTKRRKSLTEILVNVALWAGLVVMWWNHRSGDSDRRMILMIGVGTIAMVNLAFFYYPRFGDPDYNADADDVDRFSWEMVVLQSVVFLALWILSSFLAPR